MREAVDRVTKRVLVSYVVLYYCVVFVCVGVLGLRFGGNGFELRAYRCVRKRVCCVFDTSHTHTHTLTPPKRFQNTLRLFMYIICAEV